VPDPNGRTATLGAQYRTSVVARGGTAEDPEDSAFIATVPLAGALAPGGDITDDALVHAAERAERGTASRVAAEGGTYQTGGCKVSAAGVHTAVCRGTAHEGSETVALQTFLRVGDQRAVVALFMAKLSVSDAAPEADRIVGSFGL